MVAPIPFIQSILLRFSYTLIKANSIQSTKNKGHFLEMFNTVVISSMVGI